MGQQRQLLPACVVTLRAGVLVHAHPFCLVEAASAWLGGLESRPTLLCMRRVHLWSLDVALEWGAAATPVCAKQQAGFPTVPPAVLDASSFRGVPPRQCTSMHVCWCVCCATKWPAPYMRVRACCIPIEFQHAFWCLTMHACDSTHQLCWNVWVEAGSCTLLLLRCTFAVGWTLKFRLTCIAAMLPLVRGCNFAARRWLGCVCFLGCCFWTVGLVFCGLTAD